MRAPSPPLQMTEHTDDNSTDTEQKPLKQRTARGLLWGAVGSAGSQVLNLLFGIILSRALSPADYGTVGALTLFSAAAGLLSESGFVLAIVNKKEATHNDYNALFWFNIIIGAILYITLFFLATPIANFYHKAEIVPLARFLFIGFFCGAISAAPSAYYFRNLLVKERTRYYLIALIVSGIVGTTAALYGLGYWALAIQTVLFPTVNALLQWINCPWHPTFSFTWSPLRQMLPFSIKQIVTSLFTHINNNFFSLLLGRFYGMTLTGYFTQGNKWTTMGYSTVSGMLNSVGQPVLRQAATERERLHRVFLKLIRFSCFVSFPALFGLAITAREIITITITDKWLPCVPVIQILCIWGAFMPLSTLYSNLFNSLGKPAVYMWNTIALGATQLISLCITYPFGMTVMLISYTAINILWLFIWQHFTYTTIQLRLRQVISAIIPYLFISATVILIAWAAALPLRSITILSLIVKIAVAAGLYITSMRALNSTLYYECVNFIFKKQKFNDA